MLTAKFRFLPASKSGHPRVSGNAGAVQILSEEWIDYTRTPVPADPQWAYGAHFSLRLPEEYRGSGDALAQDSFHAVGHDGQFLTIVPSRDTVIVRLGTTRYPQAWDHAAFVNNVLIALQEAG